MHHNGSCVRSLMVLMVGITLFEFYLAAVVFWNFSAVLTDICLKWRKLSGTETQLIFFLYWSIPFCAFLYYQTHFWLHQPNAQYCFVVYVHRASCTCLGVTPSSARTMCPLLKITCCYAAVVYGFYNSYIGNTRMKGTACIYWSYNKLYSCWS